MPPGPVPTIRPVQKGPTPEPEVSAQGRRVAVVVSRYNAFVTDRLLEGVRAEFERLGGAPEDLVVVRASGSWELPNLAADAADTGDVDAVVALGCIIKGETSHDQHLARAVCDGLMRVSLDYGAPVGLGVLTVDTEQQAKDRAGGAQGNKGAEALRAALETLDERDRVFGPPQAQKVVHKPSYKSRR